MDKRLLRSSVVYYNAGLYKAGRSSVKILPDRQLRFRLRECASKTFCVVALVAQLIQCRASSGGSEFDPGPPHTKSLKGCLLFPSVIFS